MDRAVRTLPVLLPVALLVSLAPPVQAQFAELAAKIPATANAIVLLDGEKLLASPLAVREGWKQRYEHSFAAGLASIPPDTQRMVLAAQLDYEYMKPAWEVAVADLARPRALADIARAAKGTLDSINNAPAVALRDNAYLVTLGPQSLGVMAPANRQAVARWLREATGRSASALSPYLNASLVAAQESAIVMAFDLQDAVPPDIIRAKLASSSALAGANIDLDAAARALAGIRGLALEVAVTDAAHGRLRVHFSGDASVLAPLAKPLLLEILADLGASIDDIASWQVEAEPQRVTFHGPLSAAGQKRVFSLIDQPTSSLIAADAAAPPQATAQQKAAPSQQYFKALASILDDIRDQSKDAKTFGQSALWIDNWARRIDRLPALNVDPELLSFGQGTAAELRNISSALRGIGIQSGARTAQAYGSGGGYQTTGGYSYYTDYREPERRAIRAQERAQGATTARDIARQIENETAKIRQAMTQKYQVEF
jgi:hypothetical protein